MGLACIICRSKSPRRALPVKELPELVTERDFLLKDVPRGNPDGGTEGVCVCDGPRVWAFVAIAERYWMTFFVLSVLPAPDSPLDNNYIS